MNADRTKLKGSFAPSQSDTSIHQAKGVGTKHDRKYLVEFLITRKLLQLAAHKHVSDAVSHS
jgi:hypothetical protein